MEQKPFIVNGTVRSGQQAVQVQKLQLIQPNTMPVTSTGATLNGQPVTLLQIVPNITPKKRPGTNQVDLSSYNVVTVLPPQQTTHKTSDISTYQYVDDVGQPFEKRQRVQRGGLRTCAKEVCEKVREKGRTTYTEVANEIVNETVAMGGGGGGEFDEKNIRRRVYDALNVLMALNIVHKEKNKERTISWVGLPTSNQTQDKSHFHSEKSSLQRRIRQKETVLRDLLLQHVAFKRLVQRNRTEPSNREQSCVSLPFICMTTSNDTEVDCSISRDRSEYQLKFSSEFELHDDIEVLGRLGLTEANGADQLLPNKLRHFLKTGSGGNSGGTATTSDTGDSNMPQSSSNQTISSEDIVILTREEQCETIHEAVDNQDSESSRKRNKSVSRSLF